MRVYYRNILAASLTSAFWWRNCLLCSAGLTVFAAFVTVAVLPAFAQTTTQTAVVKGTVIDKQTRETLIGASVLLSPREQAKENEYVYAFQNARATLSMLNDDASNTQQRRGAIVGQDGTFELKNVKPGSYTLTVRYLGYKKTSTELTLEAGQAVNTELLMTTDVQGVETVVVTGVASRTQKGIAETAIGRVDAQTITENIQFTEPSQLLMGKVPGMFIQPSNGTVGSGVRINIRSNAGLLGGEPTLFIDGARVSGMDSYKVVVADEVSPLANINPQDIETIEVLKGPASACLYGTAAQNGIVLITTKRGRARSASSEDLRVSYQYLRGWQEASRYYTEDMALTFASANQLFRRGPVEQHSLNVRGATGILNYYASFDYREEQGFVPGNSLRRATGRANVDIVSSKYLTLSLSANIVHASNYIPLPIEQNGLFFGWIRNTLAGNPSMNKRFFLSDSAAIAAIQNVLTTSYFVGSASLAYVSPDIPGLRLRALVGSELLANRALTYYPPGIELSLGNVFSGRREIRNYAAQRVNVDLNAAYTREWFDGLTTNFLVGGQLFNNSYSLDNVSKDDFLTPLVPAIQGGRVLNGAGETFLQYREAGIFGRVETNYQQTYFLSFGARNDYATSLGSEASSILYPQASAAVRMDKLGVLPANINLLKLRAAFGESGKLPTLEQSRSVWRLDQGPGSTLTNPSGNQLFLQSIGNAAIRPERIREIEFGLDVEIDDKYGGELTYFLQNSRDAILTVPKPPSAGSGPVAQNVGGIDGWGAEAQLYAVFVNTAETKLQVSAMLAYSDNRIVNIGQNKFFGAPSFFVNGGFSGASNYILPGFRRGVFMDKTPLQPRYRADGYYDWSSGPVLDTALRELGSTVPIYTGSLTVTLRFLRDFTFYALADVGFGKKMLNLTRQQNTLFGNDKVFNRLATQLGLAQGQAGDARFENIAPVQGVQPLVPNTPDYRAASEAFMRLDPDRGTVANFLESADWLRVRELSLRWNARNLITRTFPEFTLLRELSFGIAVRNALLLTNYSGIDVEFNAPFGIPSQLQAQSSDIWTIMQPRVIQFTVNVGF